MVPMKTQHINAIKGKFMTHMLHSAYFFPHTVDVKWSATTQNKPDLPFWLHLYPSKHKAIAYLIGTPVTPAHQVTIHVIARRTDTFAMGEQFLTIALQEDDKYNTSTQQTVEFILLNHDPESLLSDRTGKMGRLENVVRETFRGKSVNPYIFNLVPEIQTENQNNLQNYFKNHKFG
uniref:Uncharacterized protein n=1 Tax=Panagrolaimus sp. JU765 TaxID=591449 RepID=A0AC34QHZ4_9BILA